MKPNEKMANEFADKYNGKIVGIIHGNKILKSGEKSRAGYKVEIDGLLVHTYLIKTWHINKKAISINTIQLEEAVGDHALILMSYNEIEYVAHSVNWEYWAKQEGNYDVHTRYGTREVFCKKDWFRILDLDKYKLQDYYPDLK
jgi:hypothetical protein